MNKWDVEELVKNTEKEVQEQLNLADEICDFNSNKVLEAFQRNGVKESDFGSTTGYGYDEYRKRKNRKSFFRCFACRRLHCKVTVYIRYTCINSCFICLFKTWRYNA